MSMSKIIAMIPARLRSQRIKKKNLRLLNGKPMIAYCIEAAKESGIFDEIYINSEADIFGDIAREYGILFYKRPKQLASNKTVNDEFVFDFIMHVSGDVLVQIVPTSPLITADDIKAFVSEMKSGNYDTLVSVKNNQIACIFQNKPINFKLTDPHVSSQMMIPIQPYACALMAWTYENFLSNMKEYKGAYHGGSGRIGYYVLKGLATIDVDNEEDFVLAKLALQYRNNPKSQVKEYFV